MILAPLADQIAKFKERETLNRARILVAEDHKEMRALIVSLLKREFEVVAEVEDGKALLKAESRMQPDVCVVDISMPAICGIEAAVKLRDRGSKAKVVVLTIYEDRDYLDAALKSGALGYVVKSHMASDLSPAIHDALADRQVIPSWLKFGIETECGRSL
jgi:DNA-binding NarL/FixJ family response regulator